MEFRSRKCTAVDKICGQNFAVKLQAIADKTAKTVFGGYLFATTGTCMHVSSWHFVITLSNRSWSAIFFCCWGANKISKQLHMVKVVHNCDAVNVFCCLFQRWFSECFARLWFAQFCWTRRRYYCFFGRIHKWPSRCTVLHAPFLVVVFKCLHGVAPLYLLEMCQPVSNVSGRSCLRSSTGSDLAVPQIKTSTYGPRSFAVSGRSASSADLAVPQTRFQTVGDRAFCVAAAKTWNSLPSEVTSSVILSTFKHKLKTYLFSRHFPVRNISLFFPYWCAVTAMLLRLFT